MSAKANTTMTREQLVAQIAQELASSLHTAKTVNNVSFTTKIYQHVSDKISDAGDGVAELAEGFRAAANNYTIACKAAETRQRARTAAKIARLAELEAQARGF